MNGSDLQLARQLAQRVADAGGSAWFVGGYVRDLLMGSPGKDLDIEVHGITPETLEQILDTLGERTQMGVSFGIYGLKHHNLDIAMPRRETATGRGHRDFQVDVDPFLGIDQACRRRDFTVNAMMRNVLTGELADPWGGRRDLESGILRHVCSETYVEDPLRVLRCAQFAARFGFTVAEETLQLSAAMDLSTLPKERVLGELEKALLKAEHPSIFFEVLRRMDQLEFWFPELQALIDVPQEPRFHPEGDAWNHTMLVLDAAASLRDQAEAPLDFMLAALLHDTGKPATTTIEPDGRIRSIGHEQAGVPVAEAFLQRISGRQQTLYYVRNMVSLHMRPNQLPLQNAKPKAYAKLFDSAVSPRDLLLLSRADRMGQATPMDDYEPVWALLQQQLCEFEALMQQPQVTGRDLIAVGMKPGPELGKALAYAHRMHLAGVDRDTALRQTLAEFLPDRA